jgi:hypothetical protein
MRRNLALASTALAVLFLAACLYDEGHDLPPVVKRAMPASARLLAPCGGSSGLVDYPSYGCTALVRGNGAEATEMLAATLRTAGFGVACPEAGSLVATRGDIRVTADVTQWGSLSRAGVTAGTWRPRGSRPIPRGSVVVRIDASRRSDSSGDLYRTLIAKGGRCDRPLVEPSLLSQCAIWWNGPVGTRTLEAAIRRHAGPAVEVVGRSLEGETTCTYTLRHDRGFLRLTARFDGDWHWPPLRSVRRSGPFRPNARIDETGQLEARET